MTQGIRSYANAKFAEMLPKFQTKEMTATQFRAAVMEATIQQFSISINAAATHYNHSLKTTRNTDPASVNGLGRSEDKKGGRKVTHPVNVIRVSDGSVVASSISRNKANEMVKAATDGELKIQEVTQAAETLPPEAQAAPESTTAGEPNGIPTEAEQTNLQEELAQSQAGV